MSKPGARDDRDIRRALGEAEKGIARKDLGLALQGLLKLPPDDRTPLLAPVVALLRPQITASHRESRWGLLAQWAAQVDREPRLAGSETERESVLWPLVWACGRAKDWARARRLWSLLSSQGTGEPRLAQAVSAWLTHEGLVPAEERGTLAVPPPAPPDPRLGYDPVRRPSAPVRRAPASAAGAAAGVLQLAEDLPWERFAEQVRDWGNAAPLPVAAGIWLAAGRLAVARLLRTAGEGKPAPLSAARLLQKAVEGAPAGALEREALVGFRTVASRTPDGHLRTREEAELWTAVTLGAISIPAARGRIVAALANAKAEPAAHREQWQLIERVLPGLTPPSAALWSRAVRLHAVSMAERPAPSVLVHATEELVRHPEVVTGWLRGSGKPEGQALLIASQILPAPVIDRLLGVVLEAGEAHRELAGAMLHHLLEKLASSPISHSTFAAMAREMGLPSLGPDEMQMLQSLEIPRMLGPDGEAILRRWAPRLLEGSQKLLEIALSVARDDADEERFIELFVNGQNDSQRLLAAYSVVESGDPSAPGRRLEKQLVASARGDIEALAVLMEAVIVGDFPRRLLNAVARELRAMEDRPRQGLSARAEKALERAGRLVAKPKAKAPRKPRGKRSPPPPEGDNSGR